MGTKCLLIVQGEHEVEEKEDGVMRNEIVVFHTIKLDKFSSGLICHVKAGNALLPISFLISGLGADPAP